MSSEHLLNYSRIYFAKIRYSVACVRTRNNNLKKLADSHFTGLCCVLGVCTPTCCVLIRVTFTKGCFGYELPLSFHISHVFNFVRPYQLQVPKGFGSGIGIRNWRKKKCCTCPADRRGMIFLFGFSLEHEYSRSYTSLYSLYSHTFSLIIALSLAHPHPKGHVAHDHGCVVITNHV